MQVATPDSACTYHLIGITSFGMGCGTSYGVYTRISEFLDWIESIVWNKYNWFWWCHTNYHSIILNVYWNEFYFEYIDRWEWQYKIYDLLLFDLIKFSYGNAKNVELRLISHSIQGAPWKKLLLKRIVQSSHAFNMNLVDIVKKRYLHNEK